MTATTTAADAAKAAETAHAVVETDIDGMVKKYKEVMGRATAQDVDPIAKTNLQSQMKKLEYAIMDAQDFASRLGRMRAAMMTLPKDAIVVLDDKDIWTLSKGSPE